MTENTPEQRDAAGHQRGIVRKPPPGYVTIVYYGCQSFLDQKSLEAVVDGAVIVERGNVVAERDRYRGWSESMRFFLETWVIPKLKRKSF